MLLFWFIFLSGRPMAGLFVIRILAISIIWNKLPKTDVLKQPERSKDKIIERKSGMNCKKWKSVI